MGQTILPGDPILFSNGNSIDVSAFYPSTTLQSYPLISNPVQVTGTGGTLTDSSGYSLGLAAPLTGSGTLALDLTPLAFLKIGNYAPQAAPQVVPCGLTLQAGALISGSVSVEIDGPFAVASDSALLGNFVITANSVNGDSSATLSLDYYAGSYNAGVLLFSGAGPAFQFNSTIDPPDPNTSTVRSILIFNNTTGTQTFGGVIGDAIFRAGEGGTTVFTSELQSNVSIFGGTAVLSGASGAVTNPANQNTNLILKGGSLVLDNTAANNNNRLSPHFLTFNGGKLALLGVNGGTTNQFNNFPRGSGQSTGPVFNQGLNVISVQAGTGTASFATYTFGGVPSSYDGSVDFEGLGSNARVVFNSVGAGALAPWATYNQTEFAGYDTTNGVIALSSAGRPTQVSSGTTGGYVLGTTAQAPLTADVSVYGVTMNAGTNLDLGGHTLALAGWIQNNSPASLANGTLSNASIREGDTYFGDIVFTTNSNLSISTAVGAGCILKNGTGTLTLAGSDYGTEGLSSGFPQIFVNQGTMELNLTVPVGANSTQYTNNASIVIGASAGGAGSAVLSLLADNQFTSYAYNPAQVGLQVLQAGQFNLNGHKAILQYLAIDGGKVDTGGGTLTTNSITASPVATAGQMLSGTLSLTGASPTIGVTNLGPAYDYQSGLDGLIISSKITSASALTKTGNGVLVLANAANSFGDGTVGLIISQGTIAVKNSGALGSTQQALTLGMYSGLEAETTGTLVVTNPVMSGAANFWGSPILLAGNFTQSAHGQLCVANTTVITNYANSLASSFGSSFDGKTGTGTLVLSGVATGSCTSIYSMDCGTLAFDSDTPLPPGMILRLTGGIVVAINGPRTLANPLSITGDANFEGSEAMTFDAPSGNTLGSSSTRAIYVTGSAPVTINNLNAQQSTLITGGLGTLILKGNPTNLAATRITSGSLQLQNPVAPGALLGAVNVSASGTFKLNSFNATTSNLAGAGAVQLGTGTLTASSGAFSGIISGNGSLVKTGPGNLTLSGVNTYRGVTTLGGGFLQVDGSISTSALTVNGGVLQGVGSVADVAMKAGSISPGSGGTIGTLSAQSLLWNPGAEISMDLGASGSSDQLVVAQSFQKGNSGTGTGYVFNFTGLPAFTGHGTYNLVTFSSTTFSASDFSTTGTISGYFTISGHTLQFTVADAYTAWQSTYFTAQQSADPAISGASATPQKDGVPNLIKYLCDIDPTSPMNAADHAALPVSGTAMVGQTPYLTLTYRERAALGGAVATVQESFDLQQWQPLASVSVGTDPDTGDSIMQAKVPITGTKQFLRLQVTSPP